MKRTELTLGALLAITVLAGCSSAPRYRSVPRVEPRSSSAVDPHVNGGRIVEAARDYLGAPYRNGGLSKSGLDCSGLVVSVYQRFGIALPRRSREQARFGTEVNRSQLQPGDLVFFRTGKSGRVSHVGIYSGNGQFIHASTRSRQVRFDDLDDKYFRRRFVTARRVL